MASSKQEMQSKCNTYNMFIAIILLHVVDHIVHKLSIYWKQNVLFYSL